MNATEAAQQKLRLEQYDKLTNESARIRSTLDALTRNDPEGPCQQGPFTSNYLESRTVESCRFFFSKTKGGSPSVELLLYGIDIEACEMKEFLEGKLRKRLDDVTKLIAAI